MFEKQSRTRVPPRSGRASAATKRSPKTADPAKACIGLDPKWERLSQLLQDCRGKVEGLRGETSLQLENHKLKKRSRSQLRSVLNGCDLLIQVFEVRHFKDFFQSKDTRLSENSEEFLKNNLLRCVVAFRKGNSLYIPTIEQFKRSLLGCVADTKFKEHDRVILRCFGETQLDNFIGAFAELSQAL